LQSKESVKMYKLFRVSGYYTPEGEDYPFEDYLIFEGDENDNLPKGYEDDDIFYYGINPSNVDKEYDGFIITESVEVK